MRNFLLIVLISFVEGIHLPIFKKPNTATGGMLSKLRDYRAWNLERRRVSPNCYADITSNQKWCLPSNDDLASCDGLEGDNTWWIIQIDHDTEYMCYPSSCTANDLEYLYTSELKIINASARYCTLDCPPIEFDIRGRSEDGQIMSISGTVNYADLSYDCAGSAAVNDLSNCETTSACSNSTNGLTTCAFYHEDRLTSQDWTWKLDEQICLPDECTDEANLGKMEDFHYAFLTYYELIVNNAPFTAEEIREGYLVEYSCFNAEKEDSNNTNAEKEGSKNSNAEKKGSKNSNYGLIFGVISAVLFILCLGVIYYLRMYRLGAVSMTPITAVELNNRNTNARVEAAISSPLPCDSDKVETQIVEGEEDVPSDMIISHNRPIQTNRG